MICRRFIRKMGPKPRPLGWLYIGIIVVGLPAPQVKLATKKRATGNDSCSPRNGLWE
ncbi:hypothetical protein D082_03700 [Synechocystis sp. PCC 6714]|nr:hypothetical protein D082_03700 [Synechocystis sp. PCC 6714]